MYHHISKYYDFIFLENHALTKLILTYAKTGFALDLGCATGRMTKRIKDYMDIIGVDLDSKMIEEAKNKYPEITFVVDDMVSYLSISQPFDLMVCLGNTLPHLDYYQLNTFIQQMKKKLKQDGHCLIHLLNYDLIMEQKPRFLKTIEKETFVFIREYHYHPHWIDFYTYLIADGDIHKQTNRLHPYRKKDLEIMLSSHGLHYQFINLEGNLITSFDESHYLIHVTHEQKEG